MKIIPVLMISSFMFSGFAESSDVWEKKRIDQGRKLVRIAGCNDCHTPMYSQQEGKIPEKDWLVGNDIGFRGPWGTSYAANLRLTAARFPEKSFIKYLRQKKYLPPMPGFIFNDMSDEELGSMYVFLKYLGSAGKEAPKNLLPSQKPVGPYINFVPQIDK